MHFRLQSQKWHCVFSWMSSHKGREQIAMMKRRFPQYDELVSEGSFLFQHLIYFLLYPHHVLQFFNLYNIAIYGCFVKKQAVSEKI